MNNNELFIKEAEILSKEFAAKIEKVELHAIIKKQEIDEEISKLKQKKVDFDKDLEDLKMTGEEQKEEKINAFKKKYKIDNFIDDLDEWVTEFGKKTKMFFDDLGDRVSGFYQKQKEKWDKPDEPEKL
jgi:hypothetical protein